MPWAVAATKPAAETYAAANLTRSGYACFLPTYARRLHSPRRGWRHIVRPLFSGYLFVAHQLGHPWSQIIYTPGIRDVLREGDRPAYAPDAQISALQASEALRATQPPPQASWRPGDACQVSRGPLAGAEAVVLDVRRGRARVAMMMLGQLREATVALDQLAPRA